MERLERPLAAAALAAAAVLGASSCSTETVAVPSEVHTVSAFPSGVPTVPAEDRRAFLARTDREGTAEQREAVRHVTALSGQWDGSTGNAYVSTDLASGESREAQRIAGAFAAWAHTGGQVGQVSVFDRDGRILGGVGRF
ncbi:hypothetical protein LO771_08915 [Streptacidiphilus sp. ASG 303]|uniref:hypothetical protein n=1 Tax=Streptacidiphilus sp. ASG 303 TaxID=2896847 RepID=UPI001E2CEBD0|nr:hypothetical protein [Streptacidiphilus sp. ASG 303]MCD0482518.1 hypothetical protein [Streptacidiphilus sp. ASG 303]